MPEAAARSEKHDTETKQSLRIVFPANASGSYRGLQDLTSPEMSDEAFVALITSAAFPEAIESTRDKPLIDRRWALADALPVIFRALGCPVGEVESANSAASADFDGVTIPFPNLE